MSLPVGRPGQIIRNETLARHLEEQANKFADIAACSS